jgi:hypothetical protein
MGPVLPATLRRLGLRARHDESCNVAELLGSPGSFLRSVTRTSAIARKVGHGSPLGPTRRPLPPHSICERQPSVRRLRATRSQRSSRRSWPDAHPKPGAFVGFGGFGLFSGFGWGVGLGVLAGVASGVGLRVSSGIGEGVGPGEGVDAAVGLGVRGGVRVGVEPGVGCGDWVARAFGADGVRVASLAAGGLGSSGAVAATGPGVRDSAAGSRPIATAGPYPESLETRMSGFTIRTRMMVTATPTPNPRNV